MSETVPAQLSSVQLSEAISRALEKEVRPSGSSPQIDQLAMALSKAQAMFFAPARNKSVTVKQKNGGTYSFRFASLDVIMDMIRLPLAENGLSILHITRPNPRGDLFMCTRLLHNSGQYLDAIMPVIVQPFRGDDVAGPQALGSALSYCKRYSLSTLLGVTSQDDDDANIAEGNMLVDHDYPVEPHAAERSMLERFARLANTAETARAPSGIERVLQLWQRDMAEWMRLRERPEQIERWRLLLRHIPAALDRVHGELMGQVWLAATTASSREQIDEVRAAWEGEQGRAARAKMKSLNPISYGMLFEHLRLAAARVEREAEDEQRRARVLAEAAQAEEVALAIEAVNAEASPFDPPPAEADTHAYPLLDEFGEVTSEPFEDRWAFAQAYLAACADATGQEALAQHNADGLAWARQYEEAHALLQLTAEPATAPEPAPPPAPLPQQVEGPLQEEPAQLTLLSPPAAGDRVVLHHGARNTPDLQRYVRSVRISLERIYSSADMRAWDAANRETIEMLPKSTQLTVLSLVASRKIAIGVEVAA